MDLKLKRQQTCMNTSQLMQTKPSIQNLNKLNSPMNPLNFFGNGEMSMTNHLKSIHFEYDSVQEGILMMQDMIKYAIENHENVVRDKFLVKKNRLSRKKREIFEQEMQLQRQEMELNQNPSIKRALFDLSQLKEFYGRKEKQYQTIQDVISIEDETLKKLKSIHHDKIDKLKELISATVDIQLRIDKMKKFIKYKRKQSNLMYTSTNQLSQYQMNNQFSNISPNNNNIFTQDQVIQNNNSIIQNNSSILKQLNTTSQGSIVIENNNNNNKKIQLPIVYPQSVQNKNNKISNSQSSFSLKNVGQMHTPQHRNIKRNIQEQKIDQNKMNSQIQQNNINNNRSVPSLLKNIKQTDNILSINTTQIDQQQSIIIPTEFYPNTSSIQDSQDFASLQIANNILNEEYLQIKKQISKNQQEIEKKKQYIYKYCNGYLLKNELIKECFNLVSKKLTSTMNISDKKGFRDSMTLSFKGNNNLFLTQNDQIINEFKEVQHNLNVKVQDRLLGSIIFDSMMNLIKKQETEKIQKDRQFPHISYKNFSKFNLGQILTIISLQPELKEQLFFPFELKKQAVHLLIEDVKRKI